MREERHASAQRGANRRARGSEDVDAEMHGAGLVPLAGSEQRLRVEAAVFAIAAEADGTPRRASTSAASSLPGRAR